jgi:hypothetical protein
VVGARLTTGTVAVLLLGACGDAAPTQAIEATVTVDQGNPYQGISFPLQELIETELQYSTEEISGAALDLKGSVVVDCMAKAGFEASREETPSREIQMGPPPEVFGGAAATAIQTLADVEHPQAEGSVAADAHVAASAARSSALEECYAQARDVPDPLQELRGYVETLVTDVDANVSADARVRTAQEAYGECFADLGFPDLKSESDYAGFFNSRANAILERRVAGSAGHDETLAALEQLQREEDALEPLVLQCYYSFTRVEATVRGEFEQRIVDDFGPQIIEQARKARIELIDLYDDYLDPASKSPPTGG